MANLNFITPRLATGGDLPEGTDEALHDLRAWEELGITHVVDNRLEWSDAEFVAEHSPTIEYLHNGVDDNGEDCPTSGLTSAFRSSSVPWSSRTTRFSFTATWASTGAPHSPSQRSSPSAGTRSRR